MENKTVYKDNPFSTVCSYFFKQSWEHILHLTAATNPYFLLF